MPSSDCTRDEGRVLSAFLASTLRHLQPDRRNDLREIGVCHSHLTKRILQLRSDFLGYICVHHAHQAVWTTGDSGRTQEARVTFLESVNDFGNPNAYWQTKMEIYRCFESTIHSRGTHELKSRSLIGLCLLHSSKGALRSSWTQATTHVDRLG